MEVFDHPSSPKLSSTVRPYMAPTGPLLDTVSPASTALSVVSDAPAGASLDAGACSDPDVRNKLTAVVEPVPAMTNTATEADDEARPLPEAVPVVRITEAPPSPVVASPRASAQTDPLPHSPPQRSSLSAATSAAASGRDRNRRATMDARASNRLSGFFSQLLTARRNEPAPPMPASRDRSVSPPASPVAQTFTPPPRPTTPPPSLPPPTLAELGLSMSVITPGLTSAQYATPPTNGTFLAPHYLLLCHAQGLDVLPLVGPPAPQPYALVRRVAFKSVIVMEERGVLVAIAGRRDGVRVYALEEVRRAVEWRLDLEVKREAENTRRSKELATKGKNRVGAAPVPGVNMPASSSAPSALGPTRPEPVEPPLPPPPSYASTVGHRPLITRVSTTNLAAVSNAHGRTRGASLSSVVGLNSASSMHALARASANGQQKSDWGDVAGSDEEALVAAGPEASAALDERTSAGAQAQSQPQVQVQTPSPVASPPLQIGGTTARRATISNQPTADNGATLSSMRTALAHSLLPRAPTLQPSELNAGGVSDGISFAEMLRESRLPPPEVAPNLAVRRASVVMLQSQSHPVVTGHELDQVNEDSAGQEGGEGRDSPRPRRWSFVAPSTTSLPDPVAPTHSSLDQRPATVPAIPTVPLPQSPSAPVIPSSRAPPSPRQGSHRSTRSHPLPNSRPATPPVPASAAGPSRRRLLPKLFGAFGSGKKDREKSRDRVASAGANLGGEDGVNGEVPNGGVAAAPKLEYIKLPGTKGAIMIKAVETAKKSFLAILCGESGEKVELFAGTYRTALGLSRTFILPDSPKSLELQLQGDDLVEVFLVFAQNVFGLEPATVRVREVRIGRNERRAARRRARGAGAPGASTSRVEPTVVTTTVSVGGDDPVPSASNGGTGAGAGSRRSASLVRRKREVSGRVTHHPNGDTAPPPLPPSTSSTPSQAPNDPVLAEELAALNAAQSGPYTTFQQLSFAPAFPLAAIADDYVIPPTYLEFCAYRDEWEPDAERVEAAPREEGDEEDETRFVVVSRVEGGKDDEKDEGDEESPRASGSGSGRQDSLEDDPAHALQFEPPPPPVVPTVVKWFYLDPKGVVQGPWKPSIMQNWLREGYLPPELPVRRAHETEYTLLRDLRTQVDDPAEPFKPVAVQPALPPPPEPEPEVEPEPETTEPEEITTTVEVIRGTPAPAPAPAAENPISPFGPTNALLKPISLLAQPRHFGPPALFYCSRGGHSTTIVDARGRAVLKGRIHWSGDMNMGDTQRVEAFDVDGRAILVALRQGGLEATDVGHALLDPADESRTALPNYKVVPGAVNRRGPYVWRLGTSVDSSGRAGGNGKRRAGVSNGGRKRTTPKASVSTNVAIQGNDSGDESDVYIAPEEEVIFLAREQDNVYICERSAGKFRLLRLSKTNPSPSLVAVD